jgi:hypothetical protein
MPSGPIAELIRTRSTVDGCCDEDDVVVCHACDEAELLADRPDLSDYQRYATEHMEPGIVLFLPPAIAATRPSLGLWSGPDLAFPLSAVYRYMDRP